MLSGGRVSGPGFKYHRDRTEPRSVTELVPVDCARKRERVLDLTTSAVDYNTYKGLLLYSLFGVSGTLHAPAAGKTHAMFDTNLIAHEYTTFATPAMPRSEPVVQITVDRLKTKVSNVTPIGISQLRRTLCSFP